MPVDSAKRERIRQFITSGQAVNMCPRKIARATKTSYHLVEKVVRQMVHDAVRDGRAAGRQNDELADMLGLKYCIGSYWVQKFRVEFVRLRMEARKQMGLSQATPEPAMA